MDLPAATSLTPPFVLSMPVRQTAPVVFTSPHSGQTYLQELLAQTRLSVTALRRSEDSFVDELFAAAPDFGAPLLAAVCPRVFCDVNREPWELDPRMYEDPLPAWVNSRSSRVEAGFGTIPRVVTSGEGIYRQKLRFTDAEFRISTYWQPFHDKLRALIENTRTLFGVCLLVDCHSMPRSSALNAPDIVLGDAHGAACGIGVTNHIERFFAARRYRVNRNDPYAGGYITRRYGQPQDGVEAIQIEIARNLYMEEKRNEKHPGFETMRRDLGCFVADLTANAANLLAD